jgi:uroporphyrin-III C-methyltransferase
VSEIEVDRVTGADPGANSVARMGSVTLIGGGPGTDGLLTLAGAAALREADVVLYDRLAPHANLKTLAPDAELIDVGKRPHHHPVGQSDIEDLLVSHARRGANVARLKGGDPYVFGRGGEEVAACRRAGVPVRVIPGVTSAISVPAAAGIPLTHRGISKLFTVVSGHEPLSDLEYQSLTGLGGTIVVLMGVGTLPSMTYGLQRFGMSARTPVAIVERGYSPRQRTTFAELATVVEVAARAGVSSPAVLVIGEVVGLASEGNAEAIGVVRDSAAAAAAG